MRGSFGAERGFDIADLCVADVDVADLDVTAVIR
jgi:hypothetical protein